MIVIQLSGGLGNQMFQYALYMQLKALGRHVKIDDVTCYQDQTERVPELSVFGITYDRPTKEEMIQLTDSSMHMIDRVRRKITGRKTKSYQEKQFNFDPTIFALEEAYLEGCWQSEKYFEGIREQVKEAFTFQVEVDFCNWQFLQEIEQSCSVSIHIRRGDYLENDHIGLYGGICTEQYYQEAIQLMDQQLDYPTYFVFSNDSEWAKAHFKDEKYVVVDCNSEEQGYLDLMLMSKCKHQIVANSSFSWWAAWLNANAEKTVIAPSKWLNGRDCKDIYTDGMLAI